MQAAVAEATSRPCPAGHVRRGNARNLYFALLGERGEAPGELDELTRSASRAFLVDQLHDVRGRSCDAPHDPRSLARWLEQERDTVTSAYRQYLDGRKAGGRRRLFRSRSHALYVIRALAPTKLVDGAWLYGVLSRWQDVRLAPLVRIYLEELGDGVPSMHHVLMYRNLLAAHGCEGWQQLSAEHFTQGAIQLALAHHADEFLPEVIGFNLGYEQLPLHLLITAYELRELGIDPYYFSLHVTIDNASTGHAQKSLDCVQECTTRGPDSGDFYRRVLHGFGLNAVGMGTMDAIESFNLDDEVLVMLESKARVGALVHSDRCRIGGRTLADWLTAPGELPRFLDTLQTSGWIRRGMDPSESRFWRLLHGERAPMFGVFNAYEEQLLSDWIVADDGANVVGPGTAACRRAGGAPNAGSPTLQRHLALLESDTGAPVHDAGANDECERLEQRLFAASGKSEAMSLLQGYLSPANHSTPAGLLATRLYADLFSRRR